MTVNQVHAKYILNIVTDKELSQEVQMMFGDIRLLVIIEQAIVPLRGMGQSKDSGVILKTNYIGKGPEHVRIARSLQVGNSRLVVQTWNRVH